MSPIGHFLRPRPGLLTAESALPGRDEPIRISGTHAVLGTSMVPPWPAGAETMTVAMGCFWGTERIFWQLPGVITTAAGYQGGFTKNPTYQEVCTGRTGHAESVLVVYDPSSTDAEHLLKAFWENHDPTTADRQGNDVGTQYRSAIFYTTDEQRRAAVATREAFARLLRDAQRGEPTTEIRPVDGGRERAAGTDSPGVGGVPAAAPGAGQAPAAGPFYYAEEYHQQYLHKNPNGYCNHGPNGMTCPVGLVGPRTMRHEAT